MIDIFAELSAVAQTYGEDALRMAGGAKSKVGVGQMYVFKVVEEGKNQLADKKEQRVLTTLAAQLPDWARARVPAAVGGVSVPELGFVEVHTRLPGSPPEQLTDDLAHDLGRFLSDLHGTSQSEDVSEFEGENPRPFFDYLMESALKFQTKLEASVDDEDRILVRGAVELVRGYVESHDAPPPLVIIHKDLSLNNLLVEAGRLTGIVDWAAAQTGPREWEFAIVDQRLGTAAKVVRGTYGHALDENLIRVCGALQAIRFWKSFVHDTDFVAEQRRLLERVL